MSALRIALGVLIVALAIWLAAQLFAPGSDAGPHVRDLGEREPETSREIEPLRAPTSGVRREASATGDAVSSPESATPSTSAPNAVPIDALPAEDDLRIHVVDGVSGERVGAVGVRVAWLVERPSSRSIHQVFDGHPHFPMAEVRIARKTIEETAESSRDAGVLLVAASGVFEREVSLRAAIDPWPVEPLVLTLPPFGWTRFRVQDEVGNALDVQGQLQVVRPGVGAQIQSAALEIAKGETPSCACGLGVELEASGTLADGTKLARTKARGPQAPGETTWIPLHCEPPPAVLLVRVMLAPDLPLEDGLVEIGSDQLRTTARGAISVTSSDAAKTDGEGWLRWPLEDATGGEGLRRTLELASADVSRGRLSAVLDLSREFASGETSLGEVLLREEPLLVSGLVADGSGRPVAQASIDCELFGEGPREIPSQRARATSDESGRFVLRSAHSASRLRLSASMSGFTEKEPLEVPAGSTDVVLTLEASASLRGSVRVPHGMDPTSIAVRVLTNAKDSRMHRPTRNQTVDTDGSFVLQEVPPALCTVEFSLRDHGVVETVPDVVCVSGEENRDPRLQGLELCTGWRRLTLRLLDASSRPVQIASLDLVSASTSQHRTLQSDAEGKCSTWITAEEAAFTLRAPGHRALELRWSPEEQVLRLRDGIRVTLPVEVTLFEPITHLRVMLKGADGFSTPLANVVDGVAELVVPGPGRYELEPALELVMGGATLVTTFEIETPYAVEITEDGERHLPVWRVTEAMLRAGLGK